MTQRPFKVGDNIIMTADSGKGKVFNTYNNVLLKDTEYLGKVVELDTINSNGYEVGVKVEYDNIVRYFRNNGSCSTHPGMSIRHADEVSRKDETMWRLTFLKDWRDIKSGTVFEGVKLGNNNWIYFNNGKCAIQSTDSHIVRLEPIPYGGNGRTVDVVIIDDMMPTPQKQEWVRGQAPEVGERETAIWLWKDGWEKPLYYTAIEKITIFSYTHWRYVELPPPPPVEEVEAYGMLYYLNSRAHTIDEINNAANFFSIPATAENVNKYLSTGGTPSRWVFGDEKMTLDQFINCNKANPNEKLYFTAAALEALGVK